HCIVLISSPCRPASCLFFCCIICRPPTSTPFPYTTLFRSRPAGDGAGGGGTNRGRFPGGPRRRVGGRCPGQRADGPGASGGGGQDRKSTRLNSSHVSISYAVFCLKKKKETVDD